MSTAIFLDLFGEEVVCKYSHGLSHKNVADLQHFGIVLFRGFSLCNGFTQAPNFSQVVYY